MNRIRTSFVTRVSCLLAISICSSLAQPTQQNTVVPAPGKKNKHVNEAGKYTKGKPVKQGPNSDKSGKTSPAKPKVESIGDGQYRIGNVVLDKRKRTVTFPVKVNMNSGVTEYVLVTENGKAHESIFTTSATPSHIHLASILLGMKEYPRGMWPKDHTQIPTAQGVKVEVTWPTNGPMKRLSLASIVITVNPNNHSEAGKKIPEGLWFYNGSMFHGKVFAADSEGSIISIIGDGASLLNGLRVGRENDEMHSVNGKAIPALGRTVKMVLTLPAVKKAK